MSRQVSRVPAAVAGNCKHQKPCAARVQAQEAQLLVPKAMWRRTWGLKRRVLSVHKPKTGAKSMAVRS